MLKIPEVKHIHFRWLEKAEGVRTIMDGIQPEFKSKL